MARTQYVEDWHGMCSYIKRYKKNLIINALNAQLDGYKAFFKNNVRWLKDFKFWMIDRTNAVLDVLVEYQATNDGDLLENQTALWTVYVNMENRIEFLDSDIAFTEDLPRRDLIALNDRMAPYLDNEHVEKYALQLMQRYDVAPFGEGRSAQKVAMELAAAMGLKIVKLPLRRKKKVKGSVYFTDADVRIETPKGPSTQQVEAGTIVVNQNEYNPETFAQTVIHECIHWEWHFMFFRMQAKENSDLSRVPMRPAKNDGSTKKRISGHLERHANLAAIHIIMPKDHTRNLINSFYAADTMINAHMGILATRVAIRLKNMLGISTGLIKGRMISIGYREALGIHNFNTDHYSQPFAFDSEALEPGYNYFINADAFDSLLQESGELSDLIDSGLFIYADGLVCVNDKSFIGKSRYGYRLKPWAEAHVDKCCLAFETFRSFDEEDDTIETAPDGMISMDFTAEEIKRKIYGFDVESNGVISLADGIRDAQTESEVIKEILSDVAKFNLSETLQYHLTQKGISDQQLLRDCGSYIDRSTLWRLLYPKGSKRCPQLRTILVVTLALKLPKPLALDIISKSGYDLRREEWWDTLNYILLLYYKKPIEEIDMALQDLGFDLFPKLAQSV